MADALKGYKTPYPSCTDQDHASEASMLVQHRVLQCNQGAVTSAKAEPFRKGDPTVLWPHMARHACPGGLHWGKLIKKGGCLARHSLWRPEGPATPAAASSSMSISSSSSRSRSAGFCAVLGRARPTRLHQRVTSATSWPKGGLNSSLQPSSHPGCTNGGHMICPA